MECSGVSWKLPEFPQLKLKTGCLYTEGEERQKNMQTHQMCRWQVLISKETYIPSLSWVLEK